MLLLAGRQTQRRKPSPLCHLNMDRLPTAWDAGRLRNSGSPSAPFSPAHFLPPHPSSAEPGPRAAGSDDLSWANTTAAGKARAAALHSASQVRGKPRGSARRSGPGGLQGLRVSWTCDKGLGVICKHTATCMQTWCSLSTWQPAHQGHRRLLPGAAMLSLSTPQGSMRTFPNHPKQLLPEAPEEAGTGSAVSGSQAWWRKVLESGIRLPGFPSSPCGSPAG